MTARRELAAPDLRTIPAPEDPARLMALAHRGVALDAEIADREARLAREPADAAALMDLALILQFYGRRDQALARQRRALELARLYHIPSARPARLKLLCLAAPGDLTINMPIELLLRDSDIHLFKLYLMPGESAPPAIPDHDVAIVTISEFDETRPVLEALSAIKGEWPRPMANDPAGILRLPRDGLARLLRGVPGLMVPETARMHRDTLTMDGIAARLPGTGAPFIVRPVGSHGGKNLVRIDSAPTLAEYRHAVPADQFFAAPFVDYRSADGFYRKYRIALIDRRPYLCHLAIADHWMVNYDNAGMHRNAGRRAEEARAMETFDRSFAKHHAAALAALADRIDLDFVVIDCAETRGGALLIFEADNAGAIHDLDPPDLFPYKREPMRRVIDAFRAMLKQKAAAR